MITFKEYLLQEDDDDDDVKSHTVAEAVKVYLENCDQWSDVEHPLHRYSDKWSSQNKIRVGAPRERRSESRGGTRPVQDFIFSQPGWEDYPPRARSIFCSTSENSALGDTNMMIYPFNNTKMGVASMYDLNIGDIFIGVPKNQRDEFNGMTLRWFVSMIGDVYEGIIDPKAFPRPKDFIEHMNAIKKAFTKDGKFDEMANGDEDIEGRYDEARPQKRQFVKILVEHVPECFTPERMGFTIETPDTINVAKLRYPGREVWFSGKYLSVPAQYWRQFVQEVKDAK